MAANTQKVKLSEPSDLMALAQQDRTFWSQRDQRMKDTQDLVEQQGTVDTTDVEAISVKSNDGAVIVRKLSAMVGSQEPLLNIITAEPQKEVAERAEDLIRAARFEMELRHSMGARAPLAYDEAQSLFLRGWIAGRILLNDDPNDDFLWDYTLFDPMQVYPRYGRKGLYRVCTITDTTVGEVVADWGKDALKLYGDVNDLSQKVKLYGYYDQTQMALATDAGWLKKPTPHKYPFGVPWIITLGPGAFYRATANDTSNYTKFVGQGILDIVQDQIKNNEQVLTMIHQLVAREAEPPVVVYTNAEGEVVEIDLRSGGRNVLAQTDKLEILRAGPDIQQLKILSDAYRDMVFKGTIPPVLFGDNQANMTGFLANVLQGSARDLVFPYIRALETYYTLLFRHMLVLFGNFGVDMNVVTTDRQGQMVGGINVTKLDVQGLGNPQVRVHFKDITPRDEAAKVQMAIGLTREKIISPETAREKYLDLQNPVQEETKVLSSLAYMDPMIVKMMSALALQKEMEGAGINVQDLLGVVQQMNAMTQQQQGQPIPGQNGVPAQQGGLPPHAVPPELAATAGLAPGQRPVGPAPSGPPTPQNLSLPLR